VTDKLMAAATAGRYAFVFAAPPCQSYSVAHRPQLRSDEHPLGLPTVPREWRRYLDKHNAITAFTFQLLDAAEDGGAATMAENPAARNGPPIGDAAAQWRRHAHHGSLWHTPAARARARSCWTFAQCAFAAETQKWTTIAASQNAANALGGLVQRKCQHGMGRHPQQAHGRDEHGNSRAEKAAAYPLQMNAFIAAAAAVAVAARRAAPRAETARDQPAGIVNGMSLHPHVAAAIAAMRRRPTGFASPLHRIPAERAELLDAPMPGNMHRCMLQGKPRRKALKGRPLPTTCSANLTSTQGADQPRPATVTVRDLFLPTIYDEIVLPWLADAAEATRALLRGDTPVKPSTVVLPQEAMPLWARGAVWDCRNPDDCVPVEPSTRLTALPGARQLDRERIRAIADELEWPDADIIQQVGEGGIEPRSDCPLTTVLTWHHDGITQFYREADTVVQSEMADGWVLGPTMHLPFIPIRVLPRNVVRQPRTKLVDGELIHYMKPRITQDSSDGADQSVNSGVAAADAYVELPTVQQLGRGAAIVAAAGAHDDENVAVGCDAYVIDATSAFRFCPLNVAAWWTQAFIWWSGDQVGVCVDTRMAFGGRYSPNRFERVSRLLGAYIQHRQRTFDEAHPPPPHVQAWQRHRLRLQAGGLLPRGEAQTAPRYLQVFIDDWGGAALADPVPPPTGIAAGYIDPAATVAAGGRPAGPHSRARAHAMIGISCLREAGLEAAEQKTLLGDPVIGLGIRVRVADRVMDIPDGKRADLLNSMAKAQAMATAQPPMVDIDDAQRIVGRLGNLSQVEPDLVLNMHGGHTVVGGVWARRAAHGKAGTMRMRAGSDACSGWQNTLQTATRLVEANKGVALAARGAFPLHTDPGTALSVTDASGWDGVGGYVFCADAPGTVWLVSERWPADIRAALQASATQHREKHATLELAMPAAEMLGAWAVPHAARLAGAPFKRVIAVGDCEPQTAALNSGTSSNVVMRIIASQARQLTPEWLACQIPRELNQDADTLSHPSEADSVARAATEAGLRVERASFNDHVWQLLRSALQLQHRVKRKRSADDTVISTRT
jgi:hypothetical protein